MPLFSEIGASLSGDRRPWNFGLVC